MQGCNEIWGQCKTCELRGRKLPAVNDHLVFLFFFSFSFLFKSRQALRESKTIEMKVYGNLQVCFLMAHKNLYLFPKLS